MAYQCNAIPLSYGSSVNLSIILNFTNELTYGMIEIKHIFLWELKLIKLILVSLSEKIFPFILVQKNQMSVMKDVNRIFNILPFNIP